MDVYDSFCERLNGLEAATMELECGVCTTGPEDLVPVLSDMQVLLACQSFEQSSMLAGFEPVL